MHTRLPGLLGRIDETGLWLVTGSQANELPPGAAVEVYRSRRDDTVRVHVGDRWVGLPEFGDQLDPDLTYRVLAPAPFRPRRVA